jgi:hypothetical protein
MDNEPNDEWDDGYYDEQDDDYREWHEAQQEVNNETEGFFLFGIFSGFFDWLFK